jgi:hypothetical protein
MKGRETFLIQLPLVEFSSSGPDFEFGIAASPYSGTLCIFGGKFVVSGDAWAAGAGTGAAGFSRDSAAPDTQASKAKANAALNLSINATHSAGEDSADSSLLGRRHGLLLLYLIYWKRYAFDGLRRTVRSASNSSSMEGCRDPPPPSPSPPPLSPGGGAGGMGVTGSAGGNVTRQE